MIKPNPWKDIKIGKDAPKIVNAVVEIPFGSRNKYELDKETGMIKLDRVIYSSVLYPGDYGFIPQTLWEDDDPLDVLILTRFPSYPLTIIEVRPIGLLNMVDENERDDKIIAVPTGDPFYNNIQSLKDLEEHILKEIRNFFEIYKDLQGKQVNVERLLDRDDAYKTIEFSHKEFNKKMRKVKKKSK